MNQDNSPVIDSSRRAMMDAEPGIHEPSRSKTAPDHRWIAAVIDEVLHQALQEDREDLAAFDERAAEPVMTYEELLDDLKAHAKI